MKRITTYLLYTAACLLLTTANAKASETDADISYKPNIHGTVRPRFEMETDGGKARFQIRNARLSIDGKIAKSIDYYFNADFCDRGHIKILDSWARIKITERLAFQAGQFRMPFGVDPFRGPHTYLFANRSFIGRQVCNVRAVGAKIAYSFNQLPLTIEGGVFNPTPIDNHTEWNGDMAYAAKATWNIDNISLSTGIQSIIPDEIRANLIDGAIAWKYDRWTVEGEYMNKHYTNSAHKTCHAWLAFADYEMPIKCGLFNRLSFQARYDGMTDHSNATRDENGKLFTTDPARNRITIGATIGYVKAKNMFLDFRLNYEKYFYHNGVVATTGNGDKVVAEMVLRF